MEYAALALALGLAKNGDEDAFAALVEPYRRELRAHCYRMSGSLHDADDMLQDSLLRAWKGISSFEGRSSLRTWLYKVTTSACLDALDKKSARLLPADLGPPISANAGFGPPRQDPQNPKDPIWLEPCPDEIVDDVQPTPEARYSGRESVAFAFLVALQVLPAKQRAVLILRDVLGWQATECGELLELSVASVNSALQRARETIASRVAAGTARDIAPSVAEGEAKALLRRYVEAWEQADVPLLVSILHEDATLAMPPLPEWLRGAEVIGASIAAMVFAPDAGGPFRLVEIRANGLPAFATYRKSPTTGRFEATAIHVVTLDGGRVASSITSILAFLDPSLFRAFGLPEHLDVGLATSVGSI